MEPPFGWTSTRHWAEGRIGAWLLVVFGVALSFGYYYAEAQFPKQAALAAATGTVAWAKPYRSSLYFALAGNPLQFVYDSKSGALEDVAEAMRRSQGVPVTFHYLAMAPRELIFLDGRFYPVFEVSLPGRELRTLDQVRGSHHRDNLVALYIGMPLGTFGAARLVWLRRQKRAG
jgi:hypothetical protein